VSRSSRRRGRKTPDHRPVSGSAPCDRPRSGSPTKTTSCRRPGTRVLHSPTGATRTPRRVREFVHRLPTDEDCAASRKIIYFYHPPTHRSVSPSDFTCLWAKSFLDTKQTFPRVLCDDSVIRSNLSSIHIHFYIPSSCTSEPRRSTLFKIVISLSPLYRAVFHIPSPYAWLSLGFSSQRTRFRGQVFTPVSEKSRNGFMISRLFSAQLGNQFAWEICSVYYSFIVVFTMFWSTTLRSNEFQLVPTTFNRRTKYAKLTVRKEKIRHFRNPRTVLVFFFRKAVNVTFLTLAVKRFSSMFHIFM